MKKFTNKLLHSLNPCFSGGWSRSTSAWEILCPPLIVLILVLVEDGLGEYLRKLVRSIVTTVLILVLVEDGLGGL